MRQAVERGEIARVDPATAALHMYALYHSTLAFFLASCLPAQTPAEVLAGLLDSFWAGLRPESARA